MTPTLRLASLLCLTIVLLPACGQKGPLYIKQTQAEDKPQQTSNSDQANNQE